MTPEMLLLIAIITTAVVLFAGEVFPVDKVSLLVLGGLVATGLVSPVQAVGGFGSPATITVACMLALSYGIEVNGGLNYLANKILDMAGGSEGRVLLTIVAAVGLLSAFINNTAAVALFLPLTLAMAREKHLNPSKLLMPMSFAAMFAGMCTLIGTSTNLLVYSVVQENLDWQIGMFEFAPAGLVFFLVGTLYIMLLGRYLIPSRRDPGRGLTEDYSLKHFVTELVVQPGSELIGKTLRQTRLGELYDVEVMEIIMDDKKVLATEQETTLKEGNILLVRGSPSKLMAIQDEVGVAIKALPLSDQDLEDDNIVLVEGFISPTSRLIDSTLKEVDFRRTFQATALAIRSHGRMIREKIGKTRLEFGDSLLVLTTRDRLNFLRESPDFLVLEEIRVSKIRNTQTYYAVGIFLGIVLAASAGFLTIVEASLVGVALMLLVGCFRLGELYSNLSWPTIIMLGCLIPLGEAMQNTGLAAWSSSQMLFLLQDYGPVVVLGGLYVLTTLLTSIMSNNATAVIIVPIAISMSTALEVDPKPFIIAVMFAASSAFMTPVGYQTNLFIFGPGGYRFGDFLKVGGPLNLIFSLLAILVIPFFFPF